MKLKRKKNRSGVIEAAVAAACSSPSPPVREIKVYVTQSVTIYKTNGLSGWGHSSVTIEDPKEMREVARQLNEAARRFEAGEVA